MTKLIVALDYSDQEKALELIDQLDPKHCALKVGNEMFTSFGTHFVNRLMTQGFKVFLDLKYHDIPNTVAQACAAAADLGVWMINIHASGGLDMMQAARASIDRFQNHKPLLIAVTVLTSMNDHSLNSIGIPSTVNDQVTRLAMMAHEAGVDGVVCSVFEVEALKSLCGNSFLTVTPGIRYSEESVDDQYRVATPQQARESGSDFAVIGRSITRSLTPGKVVNNILKILK